MKILRAIERADLLCPNPYTFEEKISWCDEVTGEIRRNIIKIYDMLETVADSSGSLQLPDHIPFERVECVFYKGKPMEKQDFRSFTKSLDSAKGFGKLRVVYLTMPEKIRLIEIKGEFNTGSNTIEISEHPFIEGDKIEIVPLDDLADEPDWDMAESAYVMDNQPDLIILDRDALTAESKARLAIRRAVTDVTAIDETPYDSMYIEYLLAKVALYQHDYVSYNAHMVQYNSLYEAFKREYKTRNPLTTQAKFRNYSYV